MNKCAPVRHKNYLFTLVNPKSFENIFAVILISAAYRIGEKMRHQPPHRATVVHLTLQMLQPKRRADKEQYWA
jgi:hypothetical protein